MGQWTINDIITTNTKKECSYQFIDSKFSFQCNLKVILFNYFDNNGNYQSLIKIKTNSYFYSTKIGSPIVPQTNYQRISLPYTTDADEIILKIKALLQNINPPLEDIILHIIENFNLMSKEKIGVKQVRKYLDKDELELALKIAQSYENQFLYEPLWFFAETVSHIKDQYRLSYQAYSMISKNSPHYELANQRLAVNFSIYKQFIISKTPDEIKKIQLQYITIGLPENTLYECHEELKNTLPFEERGKSLKLEEDLSDLLKLGKLADAVSLACHYQLINKPEQIYLLISSVSYISAKEVISFVAPNNPFYRDSYYVLSMLNSQKSPSPQRHRRFTNNNSLPQKSIISNDYRERIGFFIKSMNIYDLKQAIKILMPYIPKLENNPENSPKSEISKITTKIPSLKLEETSAKAIKSPSLSRNLSPPPELLIEY